MFWKRPDESLDVVGKLLRDSKGRPCERDTDRAELPAITRAQFAHRRAEPSGYPFHDGAQRRPALLEGVTRREAKVKPQRDYVRAISRSS